MGKIKPSSQEERVVGGVAYLLMFLGIIGLIVNGILLFILKKKYSRLHAGQALIIGIILLLASFASMSSITLESLIYTGEEIIPASIILAVAVGIVSIIVTLVFSITAFAGSDIQLPFMSRLVDRPGKNA
jgi:uncharacterized membrane protein